LERYFSTWEKDINYDTRLFTSVLQGYEFAERLAPPKEVEIEFGEFSGTPKWRNTSEIPRPEVKDLLLKLIAIQGDTEFASVELQRKLLDSAPSERDLRSIVQINAEEMRHGCQMSYLLLRYFGDDGKAEARKLLERRSYQVPPPALSKDDDQYPGRDPRYASLRPGEIPLTESLQDVLFRFLPYWEEVIIPAIREGKRVLIVAHGNSLRGLVKLLDHISDEKIVEVNIPTGIPLVYELDDDLIPLRSYYLGNPESRTSR
jgi:hypothetical protein